MEFKCAIDQINDFDELSTNREVGFAFEYLQKCEKELMSDNEIDIEVYTKLVYLDSKLEITAVKQLYWCLQFTTRSDIIKV